MQEFNSDVSFDHENHTITILRDTRPSDILTSFKPDARSIAVLMLPAHSLEAGKRYTITNWQSFKESEPEKEPLRHRSEWELIFSELPHTRTTATLTEV